MINTKAFLRKPIKFYDVCTVYPPSIDETIDDELFGVYRSLLTISQEELEDQIYGIEGAKDKKVPTPFEYIMIHALKKESAKIVKKAFQFFIKEDITVLENYGILIGDLEETLIYIDEVKEVRLLNEENYFEFQNLIRISLGEKTVEPPDLNIHPRLREMKAKARYRDKIKAKKASGISFDGTLASICCMGLGLNPLNIGEISYAALGKLMQRYQFKERYEIDIRSLQAGADSKKIKPKYWITNPDDEKSNY